MIMLYSDWQSCDQSPLPALRLPAELAFPTQSIEESSALVVVVIALPLEPMQTPAAEDGNWSSVVI